MKKNKLIKEAIKKLPIPETIENNKISVPVFNNIPFEIDNIKIVTFEKIKKEKKYTWNFLEIC